MFAINFNSILTVISVTFACILASCVFMEMNEIISDLILQLKNINLEKNKLMIQLKNYQYENDELIQNENEPNAFVINYEESINDMQTTINNLNLQIATRYDTSDEELIKENIKLTVRCEILEQELEKIQNKKSKKNNRKNKSFSRINKNEKEYDINKDVWNILF
jgi:hypothetical protein